MSAPGSHTTPDAALSSLMGAVIGSPETSAPGASVKTAQPPYGSPADVSQRIEAWIAAHGQQDTASLLLYEAMKALWRPAPAAGDALEYTLAQKYEDACIVANANARDVQILLEKLVAWQAVCDRIVDQYGGVAAGVDFGALGRANRAAIAQQSVRKGE